MMMRLTIDVNYGDTDADKQEKTARTLLKNIATHAGNRGMFTGNTSLHLRSWSSRVEIIPLGKLTWDPPRPARGLLRTRFEVRHVEASDDKDTE